MLIWGEGEGVQGRIQGWPTLVVRDNGAMVAAQLAIIFSFIAGDGGDLMCVVNQHVIEEGDPTTQEKGATVWCEEEAKSGHGCWKQDKERVKAFSFEKKDCSHFIHKSIVLWVFLQDLMSREHPVEAH